MRKVLSNSHCIKNSGTYGNTNIFIFIREIEEICSWASADQETAQKKECRRIPHSIINTNKLFNLIKISKLRENLQPTTTKFVNR